MLCRTMMFYVESLVKPREKETLQQALIVYQAGMRMNKHYSKLLTDFDSELSVYAAVRSTYI